MKNGSISLMRVRALRGSTSGMTNGSHLQGRIVPVMGSILHRRSRRIKVSVLIRGVVSSGGRCRVSVHCVVFVGVAHTVVAG